MELRAPLLPFLSLSPAASVNVLDHWTGQMATEHIPLSLFLPSVLQSSSLLKLQFFLSPP